jgi:FkbM family methyltransferase
VALLQTTGFNELVKAKHGYTLYNKNDRYIGKSIEIYGEFSELELSLFEQVCKPNTSLIEVGANIGTHTMALSKLVGEHGRVYAFEPQRIVFQTLCANMALNSITNVEAFQVAVSDEDGSLLIPDFNYDKENNFGGISLDKFTQGRKVPKVRLDDFLELDRLDFIKIDVEGMEQEVIEGAAVMIEKFKPILYVENDRVEKSKALLKCIKSMGYVIYAHNPRLFNPENYAKNPENIFGNIVSKNILCVHHDSTVKVDGFQAIL